jgi:hypothetical protein
MHCVGQPDPVDDDDSFLIHVNDDICRTPSLEFGTADVGGIGAVLPARNTVLGPPAFN